MVAWFSERACAMPLVDAHRVERLGDRCAEAWFSVPAGSAIFQGHYPGFPIVPGVFLVDAALQAIEVLEGRGAQVHLRELSALRLMRPVRPGEEVTLALQRLPHGAWKLEFALAEGPAAKLQMATSAAYGAGPVECGEPLPDTAAWQTISAHGIQARLAHRPPILLVDQARVCGDQAVAFKAVSLNEPCYAGVVPGAHPAALAYPQALVFESFVQACGLLLPEPEGELDDVLILGGLGRAQFFQHAWPGEVLAHDVRVQRRVGDAALVDGCIHAAGRLIAQVSDLLVARRPRSALRASAAPASSPVPTPV